MATITLYAGKLNQMPSLIGGMKQSVESYQAELQKLRQKTLSVDSSICDLSGVLAEIQTSTQIEEERVRALDSFKKQTEEFAADVVRIDGEVADMVNRTKEIFYDEYSYLRPEFEKSGWEKFCDGLQSAWKWCKERWKEVFSLLTAVRVAPSSRLLFDL